ncbi:MAG: ABC transporter ATP-binding protein [Clostridia bacterium]|nr:ABC transporter ATP-binding protein [Clostridia bacterium]
MAILVAQDIIKQYKQYDRVITAVNQVSFEIEEGEYIAVMGPSGSGKSTLIQICAGLDKPNAGHVWLRGQDLTAMNQDELCRYRGKMVGFVFQEHRLVPYYTALENILLPLTAAGRDLEQYRERLRKLVDILGLSDRLNHLPSELSGGQQQKVSIARALIHYPQVLFADEPTGNLDKAASLDVLGMMLGLKKELKQTLVIVTHDPDVAGKADRVFLMDNGVLTPKYS